MDRGERSHGYVCVTIKAVAFRVQEYVREDGSTPFGSWFDRLDHHAAAKVATAVARVSAGNTSSIKWFSGIGEIRIDWGPGYRVYFIRRGSEVVILLCGGDKSSQKRDINEARELAENV